MAGFVDAIAFISLGGFFVSFMSGNSTRLAVGIADISWSGAIAAGLIVCFVAGVTLGSFARGSRQRRRSRVLWLVTTILTGAAVAGQLDQTAAAGALMAVAMGAENAAFEEDGEVRIGLTYMTGTLVKMGQRIAAALRGDHGKPWLPYFLLWLGLAAGAVAGAAAFSLIGPASLWIAAGASAGLAVAAGKIEGRTRVDAPLM